MKVKHLVIAVAVLGALSAATWFAQRDKNSTPKADPREGQHILDDDLVRKIGGLRLHTATGDVELTTSDGSDARWIVRSYHDLPADFSKVRTLITDLREAKIVQFASARPERLDTMELDETSITLLGADGATLRTLHIGKNYQSGGRFLKFDDEAKAYVVSANPNLDGTAKNWANTALLNAKPEEVVGLTVGFPDGKSLELKRENGTASWTSASLAEGETLKDSEVNSIVSKLTGLRFSDTADPTAEDVVAARAHARGMKLTLSTGKTYDISLGRKPAPPAPPAPPPPEPAADGTVPPAPPAPPAPQPGPVYVQVQSSDGNEAINAAMEKRAFQIYEWTFTSLPTDRTTLVNPAPPPAAAPAAPPPAPAPTDEASPPADDDPAQ